MKHDYDVIVVGAGFAGVTAARECATRGLRTLVLEGRDRLGGRTMLDQFDDGTPVDLGGTYVHWTQPHIWAELVRYGLTDQLKVSRLTPDWAVRYRDGEAVWGPAAPLREAAASATEKILADSARVFPSPAKPLHNRAAVEAVDGMSLADRLAEVDLTPDERVYAEGFLSGLSGRRPDEACYSGLLRWFSMGMNNYAAFDDMVFGWKLSCATGGLLLKMLEDGGAEWRLNSPVSAIHTTEDGVSVTVGGKTITARSVVIATAAWSWPSLDVTPALPADQLTLATEGLQTGTAIKAMVRLKGEPRSFTFTGDQTVPMMMFSDRYTGEGEQVVTLYPMVQDESVVTRESVTEWVTTALPGTEVLDVRIGIHSAQDPMSGGPSFMRIGHLTKYEPHRMTKVGDRIFFATSDIAEYYHSFIDGAVETGLRAGNDVRKLLAES